MYIPFVQLTDPTGWTENLLFEDNRRYSADTCMNR